MPLLHVTPCAPSPSARLTREERGLLACAPYGTDEMPGSRLAAVQLGSGDGAAALEAAARAEGANAVLLCGAPAADRARWEALLGEVAAVRPGLDLLVAPELRELLRDRHILWKYRAAGVVHLAIAGAERDPEGARVVAGQLALHDIVSQVSGGPGGVDPALDVGADLAFFEGPSATEDARAFHDARRGELRALPPGFRRDYVSRAARVATRRRAATPTLVDSRARVAL